MNAVTKASPFVLPTGQTLIPVCIGDLPSYDYRVSVDTITFDVVRYLRDNPELPGVMLSENGELTSVIPRLRLFERLGQMYGVELFIRKPIRVLQQSLQTRAFCLADHLRINDAVQMSLARSLHEAYDPIVIVASDHKTRLLDMHTLLLAQSQIMSSLNNVMSSLESLRRAVDRRTDLVELLTLALDSIGQVVPYHTAAILRQDHRGLRYLIGRGLSSVPVAVNTDIPKSQIYQTMIRTSQSMVIDDVRTIPHWQSMSGLGEMRCWLGIPLMDGRKPLGLLSLGRKSSSPFLKDEKDMAQAFANLLLPALKWTEGNEAKQKVLRADQSLHNQPLELTEMAWDAS